VARLVDRGDQLRGLDHVALLNEGNSGAEFDGLCGLTGRPPAPRTGPWRQISQAYCTVVGLRPKTVSLLLWNRALA